MSQGRTAGRYILETPVEEGETSQTWFGRMSCEGDVRGRRVTLRLARTDDEGAARRLRAEYDRAIRIQDHRHVVDCHEFFETGLGDARSRWACLVLEYLPRYLTLRSLVAAAPAGSSGSGAVGADEAAELLRHAALGLRAVHGAGFVHGDVRPEVLFIRQVERGDLVLAVGGLASASHFRGPADSGDALAAPTSFGMPQYAAPESWNNEATPKADAYGLGFAFYELMCGRTAFEEQFAAQVRHADQSDREGAWRRWHTDASLLARPLREVCPACPEEVAVAVDGLLRKDASGRLGIDDVLAALSRTPAVSASRRREPEKRESTRIGPLGGDTADGSRRPAPAAQPVPAAGAARPGSDTGGITVVHVGGSSLRGAIQVVPKPSIVIGRKRGADVRFHAEEDRLVSGEHARAFLRDGRVYVEDLRSANGTWVNGRQARGATELLPGDVVTLGQNGPQLKLSAGGRRPSEERGAPPPAGLPDDPPRVVRQDPPPAPPPHPQRKLLVLAFVLVLAASVAALILFHDIDQPGGGAARDAGGEPR